MSARGNRLFGSDGIQSVDLGKGRARLRPGRGYLGNGICGAQSMMQESVIRPVFLSRLGSSTYSC